MANLVAGQEKKQMIDRTAAVLMSEIWHRNRWGGGGGGGGRSFTHEYDKTKLPETHLFLFSS